MTGQDAAPHRNHLDQFDLLAGYPDFDKLRMLHGNAIASDRSSVRMSTHSARGLGTDAYAVARA